MIITIIIFINDAIAQKEFVITSRHLLTQNNGDNSLPTYVVINTHNITIPFIAIHSGIGKGIGNFLTFMGRHYIIIIFIIIINTVHFIIFDFLNTATHVFTNNSLHLIKCSELSFYTMLVPIVQMY